jgi:protein-disulfide isomerase
MNRSIYVVPIAIAAAGIVLALSLYIVRVHRLALVPKGSAAQMQPITSADHIIGKPDAPVIIVEYADIDDQYSKDFQQVMEQLMIDYGPGGKVAWVYRHFPLINSDENSETHAEAAECAASVGTPHDFWAFIDAIQSAAPGAAQFDPNDYDTITTALNIPFDTFNTCLTNHQFADKVAKDGNDALAVGASGSPYSIILVKGGKPIPVDGALSYASLKKIVDQAIAQAGS